MKKKNKNKEIELSINDNDIGKEAQEYQKPSFWSRIPYAIKAILIKYWFYGAICFFVGMGLGSLGVVGLSYSLIAGLVGGAVFDLLCDNILLGLDSDKNESKNWCIYKSKKVWSIIINVLYCIGIYIICGYFCSFIVSLYKDQSNWFLQEPLSQALVCLTIDCVFLLIKYLIKIVIHNHKMKKGVANRQ